MGKTGGRPVRPNILPSPEHIVPKQRGDIGPSRAAGPSSGRFTLKFQHDDYVAGIAARRIELLLNNVVQLFFL